MRTSFRHAWLIVPILGASLGCNKADSGAPGALQAQAADRNGAAALAATVPFGARMTQLDKSGDFSGMAAAARVQIQAAPTDSSAHYYLARGSFYNGDFALASTELEALTQAAPYADDAEALEMLRVARYLEGRYAGQKFEPVLAVKSDIQAQNEEWRAKSAALLAAKKYDEIEAIASEQTRNPTISSDGSWTLAPFYIGLWDGVKDAKTDAQWRQNHAKVVAWQAARPTSQLARTCLARSWTKGAWTARGNDYAPKVAPEAWEIVDARQQKAAPILQKLLAEKVTSPLVYAAAQRFGLLGGAPREWHDEILRRGAAQFPTYTDFYRHHSFYLLPRWDGAPGEWEQSAQNQADSEAARAGTQAGDQLYARLVWNQWDYYSNMHKETQIDWPRTKRGFESILAQNSNSLSAATMYMRLCYQWNEGVKARELLQIIGGRADTGSWNSPRDFARTRIILLRLLP